jgi:hypothetical protein
LRFEWRNSIAPLEKVPAQRGSNDALPHIRAGSLHHDSQRWHIFRSTRNFRVFLGLHRDGRFESFLGTFCACLTDQFPHFVFPRKVTSAVVATGNCYAVHIRPYRRHG